MKSPLAQNSRTGADGVEHHQPRDMSAARLLLWAARGAAPLAILWLFFPVLTGERQLAFRDVSHFYTPLYEHVADRCAAQILPLWNPLDATGVPLLGETTTAIFYPLRYVLFALPIATETAIGWYLVMHLLMASGTAAIAARWCGVSRRGASLAASAYPLSGSVLFLYTNLPFLVSAAWMPLILGAALGRRGPRPRIGFFVISLSLAMMVCGGDPHTAFHSALLCTLVLLVNLRREKSRLAVLVAACVAAALLTLPQIVASTSWSAQSYRARHDEASQWWTAPHRESQQHDAFEFSLAPWHLLELFSPSLAGDLFPIYRRISVLIPGDGRMWVPSVYAGLVVALALITVFFNRRFDRWFAIAVLAALLAMGHFGIGWLLSLSSPRFAAVDPAWGGAYWWLYHLVPGYDVFRYPAKWLPFLSLAGTIIAARWLDDIVRFPPTSLFRVLLVLAAMGAVVWAGVRWLETTWPFAPPHPADRFWGPLDISGGLQRAGESVLHTLVVLGVITATVLWLRVSLRGGGTSSMNVRTRRHLAASLLVLLTTCELAIAATYWIATTDRGAVIAAVSSGDDRPLALRWLRTRTGGGFPSAWRVTSSEARLVEVDASQRASWFGRWHLVDGAAVFNNMTSIRSYAMVSFWNALAVHSASATEEESQKLWGEIRNWLSINGTVKASSQSRQVTLNDQTLVVVDVTRSVTTQVQPPLQLHWEWTDAAKPASDAHDLVRILQRLRDFGAGSAPEVSGGRAGGRSGENVPNGAATLRVVQENAESLRLQLSTAIPVLVVRPVYQDGNWRAALRPTADVRDRGTARQEDPSVELEVHRVDVLKQGVVVPPGDWELHLRYWPKWLPWTLALAAAAWIGWLILLLRVGVLCRGAQAAGASRAVTVRRDD